MHLLHLVNGHPPRPLASLDRLPDEGYVWADIERSEALSWDRWLQACTGYNLAAQHLADSLNEEHPSFFDGTADYDMLIFEGLGPRDDPFPLETRTVAFFLFDRLLVTVRAADNVSLMQMYARLLEGRARPPASVLLLVHGILDLMVNRYLHVREPLDRKLTALQDELLDPSDPNEDWRALLEGRRVARQLEQLCENQLEALEAWRRGTRLDWTENESIRIRDLAEHVDRVLSHASGLERDVEAAVQLHFASVAHRTNRVMRTLTVFSAIFLPLTFIAGIYGMNFAHMPELRWRLGYPGALALMALVALVLLLIFKRRRYF